MCVNCSEPFRERTHSKTSRLRQTVQSGQVAWIYTQVLGRQWHKTWSDQYRQSDGKKSRKLVQKGRRDGEKPAQDCLHIQAAYRENTLSGVGVNGADGLTDTLTLFNTMAFPFGWGYIQLKTKPQVTHTRTHSLTHAHTHTSSPETAVVLDYCIIEIKADHWKTERTHTDAHTHTQRKKKQQQKNEKKWLSCRK